jgi:intracellular multiplication protein IcmL
MAEAGSNVPAGNDSKGAAASKTKGGKPAENSGANDLVGGPLMTVVVRNEFYRDGFRNLIKIAIAEAAIIVALIITFIAYIDTTRTQDHYFATTADGRIMPMVPLEQESMPQSALLSWAAQAASDTMTFGFHDYERRLQSSAHYFTREGWTTFDAALNTSRVIESVTALNEVLTAEPRSAPIPLKHGVLGGKYYWVVKVPLKVTYMSGTESHIETPDVTLVIYRVSELENPKGVGIQQWIATPAGAVGNGE